MIDSKVVDEISRITESYGMSLAIGNSKVPVISDLKQMLRIASMTFRREEHDNLVEFVSDPIEGVAGKEEMVMSLIPGLTLNAVHSGHHQNDDTQLLRSCLSIKLGKKQTIIDSLDANTPGPFTGGIATYVQDIGFYVIKLLSRNT
jgi:hypothetical protein